MEKAAEYSNCDLVPGEYEGLFLLRPSNVIDVLRLHLMECCCWSNM